MTEIEGKKQDCPECGKPLRIIEKVPLHARDSGRSHLSTPLASWIYECDEHGRFRIDIAGNAKRV